MRAKNEGQGSWFSGYPLNFYVTLSRCLLSAPQFSHYRIRMLSEVPSSFNIGYSQHQGGKEDKLQVKGQLVPRACRIGKMRCGGPRESILEPAEKPKFWGARNGVGRELSDLPDLTQGARGVIVLLAQARLDPVIHLHVRAGGGSQCH